MSKWLPLCAPLSSQLHRPCRNAMRSANMDVSRRCHHPQSSTTSKPNPGVTGGRRRMALRRRVAAAAATVAWPHGWRPQAEAIESSGQGEEEWGGKKKEEEKRSKPSPFFAFWAVDGLATTILLHLDSSMVQQDCGVLTLFSQWWDSWCIMWQSPGETGLTRTGHYVLKWGFTRTFPWNQDATVK